jgi:hypothetical protein
MPEIVRGLPWHLTDRDAAGDSLSHVARAAHAFDAAHNPMRELENRCEVATDLSAWWEHLPTPRIPPDHIIAGGHVTSGRLARVSFWFRGARGGESQVAEFQAQGLPGDSQDQGGLMLTSLSVL